MAICDRCKHPIAGNSKDPIHVTSLGTHHEACMRLAWREHDQAKVDRKRAGNARRSASAKARRTPAPAASPEPAPVPPPAEPVEDPLS